MHFVYCCFIEMVCGTINITTERVIKKLKEIIFLIHSCKQHFIRADLKESLVTIFPELI